MGIFGIFILVLVLIGFSTTFAYAEQTPVKWKSGYEVGILNSAPDRPIPVKITTFSQDALKVEWEPPETEKHETVAGYIILRKEMNSDYQKIIESSNGKKTFYIDRKLPQGYYAYKVLPIIESAKSDKISMHGIDRKNNLFDAYMKGQELLAKKVWDAQKIQSELPDSYSIEFKGIDKMNDPDFQKKITYELIRAEQLFKKLFDVKINH